MKIVLLGFGAIAEESLLALIRYNFDVSCVLLPIDCDIERVRQIAQNEHLNCLELKSKSDLENVLLSLPPFDFLIIASFPYIISSTVFNIPRYGAINIHGSLLPKYRGYHPVHWAIINDEKETGVTVHKVEETADTGEILAQKKIKINNRDDINSLIQKIADNGARLLIKVLLRLEKNNMKVAGKKQDSQISSYAPKRYPKDGRINWRNSSRSIFNLIRTLKFPYPNAFFFDMKNEKNETIETFIPSSPGKVIAKINQFYLVTTGDGVIMIKTKKPLNIGEKLQ